VRGCVVDHGVVESSPELRLRLVVPLIASFKMSLPERESFTTVVCRTSVGFVLSVCPLRSDVYAHRRNE